MSAFPSPLASPALTPRQMAILIPYGALLWFLAALLVRMLNPMGALGGVAGIITYALVIPGTIPTIMIMRRIAGIAPAQLIAATALTVATALLLDGVAHGWFPALYGPDPTRHAAGSGAIFWGAGVAIVLALCWPTPRTIASRP